MDNTNIRNSRSTEKRVFESREAEERPQAFFGGNSRFNVAKEILDADPEHAYGFVVYSSGNYEQKENYYDAINRGYSPVPTSEHPKLARRHVATPFRESREDQLYTTGGQILVKRDKKIDIAEKEYFTGNQQRQEYISEMYRQPDPRFARPYIDQRTRVNLF